MTTRRPVIRALNRLASSRPLLACAAVLVLLPVPWQDAAPGPNFVAAVLLASGLARRGLYDAAVLLTRKGVAALALVGFALSLDRYSAGQGEAWGSSMAGWAILAAAAGLLAWRRTEQIEQRREARQDAGQAELLAALTTVHLRRICSPDDEGVIRSRRGVASR